MLRDRPDKRSVITYISQFIRISHPVGTSRPLHAQPPSETAIVSMSVPSYQTALHRLSEELALYRPLVDWLDGIVKDRRIQTSPAEEDKDRQDTNVDDYKVWKIFMTHVSKKGFLQCIHVKIHYSLYLAGPILVVRESAQGILGKANDLQRNSRIYAGC